MLLIQMKQHLPINIYICTDTADSANNVVDVDTGEYYFPYVPAGQHRLRADNTPDGMVFPSTASGDDILLLPSE